MNRTPRLKEITSSALYMPQIISSHHVCEWWMGLEKPSYKSSWCSRCNNNSCMHHDHAWQVHVWVKFALKIEAGLSNSHVWRPGLATVLTVSVWTARNFRKILIKWCWCTQLEAFRYQGCIWWLDLYSLQITDDIKNSGKFTIFEGVKGTL